jgi:hypothetical protein
MWQPFKSKSILLAIAAIVGTLAAYVAGEITLQVAILAILGAIEAMFIRAGIAKNGKQK